MTSVRNESKAGIRKIILENGETRYEARINRTGEAVKSKRFKTLDEARAWKREIDYNVDKQGSTVDPTKILVSTVINDYLKFKANSRTPLASNQIGEYERVSLDLGDFAIGKLKGADVENWMSLLLQQTKLVRDKTVADKSIKKMIEKQAYQPSTVRKFYYAFKKASEWHAAAHNYNLNKTLFKHEKGEVPGAWEGHRDRRLVEGEEERLYAAGIERKNTYTRKDWEQLIGFTLETALRQQEVVWAKWDNIRADGYKLFVPKAHSKTKKDRFVLLSKRAREIIAELRETRPDKEPRIFHLFPSPRALCKAFGQLRDRAEIEDLHFHDLRHEATSRLCISGKLQIMELMEMTGHATMTTFQGYLHLLAGADSVLLD